MTTNTNNPKHISWLEWFDVHATPTQVRALMLSTKPLSNERRQRILAGLPFTGVDNLDDVLEALSIISRP